MGTPTTIRMAAVLLWLNAIGFGLPCLLGIRNLATGRDIPFIMGYPAYGRGPLERLGVHTSTWLLIAFLLVCVLEAVAGLLLWGGHKSGAILALLLLPAGAFFWWGFALPIPPLTAFVRTALILVSWRSLK